MSIDDLKAIIVFLAIIAIAFFLLRYLIKKSDEQYYKND